jgi:hypothetical protein
MKFDFGYWGKPLIFLRRHSSAATSLIAQVARFFRSSGAADSNLATTLMETADGRAGLDARQAQELRAAASAWLSVIR